MLSFASEVLLFQIILLNEQKYPAKLCYSRLITATPSLQPS